MEPAPDYLAPVMTGTCHVVLQTDDAIIMASDSRSAGSAYVSSPTTNKIWQLAPRIFVGRSGIASQTQYFANSGKVVLSNLALLGSGKRAVRSVSTWAAQVLQQKRDMLSVSLVVAGWDETGPQIYDIAPSGFLIQRKIVATGSGSVYIASWIDRNYREDFKVDEAIAFAIRAISHAIVRDGACGGVVNLVVITKDGAKRRTIKPDAQPVKPEDIKT
jgi:20S proteasome alpha/beta subunit